MNKEQENAFEAIWPGVQSEIASARRRRKAVRMAASLCLLLVAGGVAIGVFHHRSPSLLAFNSWQMPEVSAEKGISPDYPLARGKHIYVVQGQSNQQHIACIEKKTGMLLWTNPLIFSTCRLAADDLRVYVLAGKNGGWTCAALDANSGKILWSEAATELHSGGVSTLTVLGNGLCCTEGNHLILRDRENGKLVWNKTVGHSGILSAPVQCENILFAASSAEVFALNPASGELVWNQHLPGASLLPGITQSIIEASAGHVYCAARNSTGKGELWCVDTGTHNVLWSRETQVAYKLHLYAGRVFVRSTDLSAFDTQTGSPLWQIPVGGCGSVSFQGGRVYLVDAAERSRVLALNLLTGQPVWSRLMAASCTGLIVSEEVGLLSGNNRTLYAFALKHS